MCQIQKKNLDIHIHSDIFRVNHNYEGVKGNKRFKELEKCLTGRLYAKFPSFPEDFD